MAHIFAEGSTIAKNAFDALLSRPEFPKYARLTTTEKVKLNDRINLPNHAITLQKLIWSTRHISEEDTLDLERFEKNVLSKQVQQIADGIGAAVLEALDNAVSLDFRPKSGVFILGQLAANRLEGELDSPYYVSPHVLPTSGYAIRPGDVHIVLGSLLCPMSQVASAAYLGVRWICDYSNRSYEDGSNLDTALGVSIAKEATVHKFVVES